MAPPRAPINGFSGGNSDGIFESSNKYRPVSLDDYDSLASESKTYSNRSIFEFFQLQPSSNEILSRGKSTATSSKSDETNTSSDVSLGFDDDDDTANDVIENRDRTPVMATSPKAGREYITSFTTTTTVRPDVSRGVEIIRSLVEQARSTPPVPTGSVQSLTTLKTMPASKEIENQHRETGRTTTTTSRTTTSTRSTTTTNIPANHRMVPMPSTTRRVPANHQTHEDLIKSFTERPTTTTKPKQKSRNTAELAIDINDIQDLLSKVPITPPKANPARQSTSRPVRSQQSK